MSRLPSPPRPSVLSTVLGCALLATPATGFAADVRFCVEVDVDFADAAGGDFWLDNSYHRAARGFRARAVERLTGQIAWEGWLDATGAHLGCTPEIALQNGETYYLYVESSASIHGNIIGALDNEVDNNIAIASFGPYVPSQSETLTLPPLPGAAEPRWRQLVATTFALQRYNGQLSGEWFYLYNQPCPSYPNGPYLCAWESGARVSVYLDRTNLKYTIGHEMGHAVNVLVDSGGYGLGESYHADEEGCDGTANPITPIHAPLTKEYQSAAAGEGIADWYAALTWNVVGPGEDCGFVSIHNADFNMDGEVDVEAHFEYPCYGDPWDGPGNGGVEAGTHDWLEEMVLGADPQDCEGTLENRSTRFDWLRYLWAMTTVEQVPVSVLWDTMDAADQHNWCPRDVVGGCTLPLDRWATAVAAKGIQAEHDRQKAHGLDH